MLSRCTSNQDDRRLGSGSSMGVKRSTDLRRCGGCPECKSLNTIRHGRRCKDASSKKPGTRPQLYFERQKALPVVAWASLGSRLLRKLGHSILIRVGGRGDSRRRNGSWSGIRADSHHPKERSIEPFLFRFLPSSAADECAIPSNARDVANYIKNEQLR
jgi:hypothetical protein